MSPSLFEFNARSSINYIANNEPDGLVLKPLLLIVLLKKQHLIIPLCGKESHSVLFSCTLKHYSK